MALLTNPLMTGFDQGVDAPPRWNGLVPDDARGPLTVGDPTDPASLAGTQVGVDAARDIVEQTYAKMLAAQQQATDQGQWIGGQVWEGGHPTGAGMLDAASRYAMGLGTKDVDVGGVPRVMLRDLTPAESTVQTRVPFSVDQLPFANQRPDLKVGIDSATQVPAHADANAARFRSLPGLSIPPDASTAEATEGLVNHVAGNVVATFDAVPHDAAEANAEWYDGAHRLTKDVADNGPDPSNPVETPYTHQNVAGAFAALSPQKDWFENVELGKRLTDIDLNQRDTAWSPEMTNWTQEYLTGKAAEAEKVAAAKSVKAGTDVAPDYSKVTAAQAIVDRLSNNGHPDGGLTYGSLTAPQDQAYCARSFDQAHSTDRS